MNKFFSNESLFGRFFGQLGDIVIVNFLFVLTSIPLVTVGASLCAMNHAFLKRRRESDEPISRLYAEGLKSNCKQGIAGWLLLLAVTAFFLVDRYAFTADTVFFNPFLSMLVTVLLCLVYFTSLWLFAVIAAFEGTLPRLCAAAFRFVVLHLPTTLALAAFPFLISFLMLSGFTAFAFLGSLFLLFGFGLFGWVYSFLYIRAFAPFLDA